MKRFLISVLKAILYTAVFLLIQIAVTLILSVGASLIEELFSHLGGYVYVDSGDLVSAVTCISAVFTLFFFLILFALRGKSFAREVRWHKMPSAAKGILGPLECGFGLSVLSSFVLMLIPFPDAWFASYDEAMEMMMAGSPLFLAAATVIAAPFVEEVVFRGLVYTRLCRGMKRWIAALLSAVIFGLVHGTLLHLVYTVPMGLLLCLFYEKYRTLWAPIVFHMSFNLAGTVLGYYTLSTAVSVAVLLAIGLYLTVMGFLSMHWYREETMTGNDAPSSDI